jgi:putative salt-induced outer membrane protein YdiY
LSAAGLLADQITLKNGDRLTGTIMKSDEKGLTIKAEYGGAITVPFDAVTSIVSSQQLFLSLKDGQGLVGSVSTDGDKLTVQTKDTGQVTAAKTEVKTIRSPEEEKVYETELERYRNPRLRDLWAGFIDTGLSSASGNAQTTSFNLTMNAARSTSRDKISTYFTSIYAHSTVAGKGLLTAEATRGGLNYDLNVGPKTFAFGLVNLEEDKFQKLDLRFVGGGGFGYHLLKNETTTFDLSAGGSVNREFYSTGLNRTSGEALLGEELTKKFHKSTTIHEKLVLYPNVSDVGQFRLMFDAGSVTALNKWLGFQVSVSDRYITNPLPGTKTNDLLLTTGLRITFAK